MRADWSDGDIEFESSVKLVWSPILQYKLASNLVFESSVKLVWSPIIMPFIRELYEFESSVKLVWSPIHLLRYLLQL